MAVESLVDILIHPLVLLNISDYYTRLLASSNAPKTRRTLVLLAKPRLFFPSRLLIRPLVAGICLGIHTGRSVSIQTSFELLLKDDTYEIDLEWMEAKLDQYKQVFPTLDVMGWFTMRNGADTWTRSVHTSLATRFESPLLLVLDPLKLYDASGAGEIPLKVYEGHAEISTDAVDGSRGTEVTDKTEATDQATSTSTLSFVECDWTLETGEAERIAVDHVTKVSTHEDISMGTGSGQGTTSVTHSDRDSVSETATITYLQGQANAVRQFQSRLHLITAYVAAVKTGELAADPEILRHIASILDRVPVMQSTEFKKEMQQELLDVRLTQHLSGLLKSLALFTNVATN